MENDWFPRLAEFVALSRQFNDSKFRELEKEFLGVDIVKMLVERVKQVQEVDKRRREVLESKSDRIKELEAELKRLKQGSSDDYISQLNNAHAQMRESKD